MDTREFPKYVYTSGSIYLLSRPPMELQWNSNRGHPCMISYQGILYNLYAMSLF